MDLIKKAVEDAKNIKELKIKSAEQQLLEKLQPEVRSLAESLLEQEGEKLDPEMEDNAMGDLDAILGGGEEGALGGLGDEGGAMSPDDQAVMDGIPSGDVDGEVLCSCPAEDVKGAPKAVTVTLDKLVELAEEQIKEAVEGERALLEKITEEEDVDGPVSNLDGDGLDVMDEEEKIDENQMITLKVKTLTDMVTGLTEEMIFNYTPQPHGHAGRPNDREIAEYEDVMKLKDELEEEKQKVDKENKKLKKENTNIKKKYEVLSEKYSSLKTEANERIRSAKVQIQEHKTEKRNSIKDIEKLVLENAKLKAMNKIYESKKLNEKQRIGIVKLIQDSKTVDEVNKSFNAAMKLVENVDVTRSYNRRGRRTSTTLSEIKAAMNTKQQIVESSRTLKESKQEDAAIMRNQRLAGIPLEEE
jgi:myosin heavy subunit